MAASSDGGVPCGVKGVRLTPMPTACRDSHGPARFLRSPVPAAPEGGRSASGAVSKLRDHSSTVPASYDTRPGRFGHQRSTTMAPSRTRAPAQDILRADVGAFVSQASR